VETVAVVGGTGFVGRRVVDALRASGRAPRPLSRRTGFDVLRPDAEALRGCAAVINLAGIKREAGAQTFRAVHVDAVESLVAAMKAAGVPRLVHVSVVAAKEAPAWPYHHTKWLGEQAVRASGLAWTILRPGVIYGEGDDLLGHLSLMIRAAPVFPIAGAGTAPMMPVDVEDVARAAVAALAAPPGRSYDVVGPDRLTLRDVVSRTADALGRPVWIVPTPLVLMRPPVFLMEKLFRHPLSTRAQLNMLVEGLAGDPGPARRELGIEPAPFTADRLRPRLPRRAARPIPAAAFGALLAAAILGVGAGFLRGGDVWTSLFAAGLVLAAGALGIGGVRDLLRPTPGRLALGVGIGLLQFAVTKAVLAGLSAAWPGWTSLARDLYAWQGPHGRLFLAATLPLVVLSEELVWRGAVTRFLADRAGWLAGVGGGALLFAAAHAVSGNPLLVAAAAICGAFWGWLAEAFDDLSVPFAAHLVWDVLLLFAWPAVQG
jgi:uncharacterized protein YbjT (DUF2867 family)/membrane protease YdiL (CAAX protease family)